MSSSRDLVAEVMRNPKYQELLRRRSRISAIFFVITIIIYSGFILTLAFNPALFGQAIGGMTMSIGVLTAIIVLVSASFLIALYVYISNKVFDPLLAEVIKEIQQ